MNWNARVDLFEQFRREHEFGIGTVAGVAAKFGGSSPDGAAGDRRGSIRKGSVAIFWQRAREAANRVRWPIRGHSVECHADNASG